MISLVVIMTIRKEQATKFREFEDHAARIMKKYKGEIVEMVSGDAGDELFKEIHVVCFPNREFYEAYKNDVELKSFLELRSLSVFRSEIHSEFEDGHIFQE